MKVATSNSGPLIHLATVSLVDYLFKIFNKIYIPEAVYGEIVVKGKELGYPNALIIEQAILDEKIVVKKESEDLQNSIFSKLHPGEISAINLALHSKSKIILLDDEEARIIARGMKLQVKGTLGLLIEVFREGHIDFQSAVKYLEELNNLMYLSSDVFKLVEDELRRIKDK